MNKNPPPWQRARALLFACSRFGGTGYFSFRRPTRVRAAKIDAFDVRGLFRRFLYALVSRDVSSSWLFDPLSDPPPPPVTRAAHAPSRPGQRPPMTKFILSLTARVTVYYGFLLTFTSGRLQNRRRPWPARRTAKQNAAGRPEVCTRFRCEGRGGVERGGNSERSPVRSHR